MVDKNNGVIVDFAPNGNIFRSRIKAPIQEIIIDGNGMGTAGSHVIKAREKMMNSWVLVISFKVDKKTKAILGYIKLQIPAGGANPSPPVGPALGQRGLNIMDFCKAFNDKTKDVEKGAPIPVVITAYKDRSFDFVTKLPPVSYYLKKAAKIKKGNSTPGRTLVGKVTSSDVEKIAKEKMQDLNAIDLNGAINMVKGSAVSMGMEVVN